MTSLPASTKTVTTLKQSDRYYRTPDNRIGLGIEFTRDMVTQMDFQTSRVANLVPGKSHVRLRFDEFDSWDEIANILRTSLFMNEKIDETVNKHKQEPELLVDEDVFLQWQANDTVTQTTEIICAKCGCHNRVSSNKYAECIQVRKTTDTGIHTIYYACSHCNQTYQLAWTRRK